MNRLKNYSYLQNINIKFYLKTRIPIMHRFFFRVNSQNPDFVENFCNDMHNGFHFAVHKLFNQLK